MPELPEVETTRRLIAPVLIGREIARVETTGASYLFLTPPAVLARKLVGHRVCELRRVGKYLLAELDDGAKLLIHLGMTGQLFASGASSVRLLSATTRAALAPDEQREFEPDAHTHFRIHFKDGGLQVWLRDVRKFGKLAWLAPGASHPRLARLGRDALEVDGALLFEASRGRKVAAKALLLDQSLVTGAGNIYADEALFLAGVRPARRASKLTRRECDALADALRRVLARSIETGGSSISDYIAPDGRDGAYQDERRVYARAGEPCLTCGARIKRVVVAQRGTHYCPRCQR